MDHLRYFSLPSEAYVPGINAKPPSSFLERICQSSPPFNHERWHDNHVYLCGFELYNKGFYWEAHEFWEELWHFCGRKNKSAQCLKGLILITAACLKHKMNQRPQTLRLLKRAEEVLSTLCVSPYMGIKPPQLIHDIKTTITKLKEEDKFEPITLSLRHE